MTEGRTIAQPSEGTTLMAQRQASGPPPPRRREPLAPMDLRLTAALVAVAALGVCFGALVAKAAG